MDGNRNPFFQRNTIANMKIIKTNKQEPYYSFCLQGKKTVEGRLNKGKFRTVEIGDILKISDSADFEVIDKKTYSNFKDMIINEGIENLVPDKKNIEEALGVYYEFYTSEQEKEFGVVAFRIKKID
jgi:ASC-1-like (ASCH) protein